MRKSLLKSKTILELENSIRIHGHKAEEQFLSCLEKQGSPIIELINNENVYNLVTFIYKDDMKCKNVLFAPYIGTDRYKDKYRDFLMERIDNTDLWYISYEIRNDAKVLYYFSPNDRLDNDWEYRFDSNAIHDKLNRNVFENSDDKGSILIMPKSEKNIWSKKVNDVPTGNIEEFSFESENLKDKHKITIYTPYGYNKDEEPYKFLFLTDGSEYIDLLNAIDSLNNLIANKKIPPIVAVFIDSIEETREEEFSCNDKFCSVIAEEIVPWVRKKYNISSNASNGIIGGVSLGGLNASYLALNYSSIFGNVITQSGSYWYHPDEFIDTHGNCYMSFMYKEMKKLPIKFYLDIGTYELKKMINTNLNFKNALKEKGYDVDFHWFNSAHDYLSWGESLAHGLISLIGV